VVVVTFSDFERCLLFHVGLDIHSKHIAIFALDEKGLVVHRSQVRGIQDLVRVLTGLPDRFEVCYEASCRYGDFHDLLRPLAARVLVATQASCGWFSAQAIDNDGAALLNGWALISFPDCHFIHGVLPQPFDEGGVHAQGDLCEVHHRTRPRSCTPQAGAGRAPGANRAPGADRTPSRRARRSAGAPASCRLKGETGVQEL
jgi:hypothetical protein